MKRFISAGCLIALMAATSLPMSGCATLGKWHEEACSHASTVKERLQALKTDLEAIRQVLAVVLPANAETYIPGIGLVNRDTINALFQAVDIAILGVNILIDQACPSQLYADNIEQRVRQLVDSQPVLQHVRRQLTMKRL